MNILLIAKEGTRMIGDMEYRAMLKRRSPEYIETAVLKKPVRADVETIKKRYLICKACGNSYDSGHKCRHYRGCCFGNWRTKPESKCPADKW